ncbi:MAG: hypothetical protein AAFV29_24975, partial [Myxococcota bacterium]
PWTLGQGNLQWKATMSFWRTDRKFASSLDAQANIEGETRATPGQVIPFDPETGGVLTTTGLEIKGQLGLLDWLDVSLTIPGLVMGFDTEPVDNVSTRVGLGDVRVGLTARLPASLFDDIPVMVGGRVVAKLPTGDFDPSVFSVPLTEGQLDVAGWLSLGVSLPAQSWAVAEVGYRGRFANPQNDRNPGEEWAFNAEVGTRLISSLAAKVAADGLIGTQGQIDRFGTSTLVPRRRAFSAWLGLFWTMTPTLTLDLAGRWLFAGEDFPTGVQVFAGLRGVVALF